MTRLFVLIFLCAALAACDKNKFQTKPTLELKNMNGNIVPSGASLLLEFKFTDKEGDINDTLYVMKVRTNKIKVPTIRDAFTLLVPTFPKNTQGEVQVLLDHTIHLESAINPPKDPVTGKNQNDTLMLKFVLRDKAGNLSDTVTAGPVVVLR
ncbi:MAG: hypothetical protein WCF67_25550 [Chitinophagaceae bacterium]